MKKMKTISLIMSAIIISVSVTSIGGAVTLTNGIDVGVDYWIGLVTPTIDIENQSIIVNADMGENDTYIVDDTLDIDINILNNTDRSSFILPRAMFYSVLVVRKAELTWGFDYFSRMFPVKAIGSINVVESMLGNNTIINTISLPLQYAITNTTYDDGEQITMHIMTMGLLPGDTVGILGGSLPIIDYRSIKLNVTYV